MRHVRRGERTRLRNEYARIRRVITAEAPTPEPRPYESFRTRALAKEETTRTSELTPSYKVLSLIGEVSVATTLDFFELFALQMEICFSLSELPIYETRAIATEENIATEAEPRYGGEIDTIWLAFEDCKEPVYETSLSLRPLTLENVAHLVYESFSARALAFEDVSVLKPAWVRTWVPVLEESLQLAGDTYSLVAFIREISYARFETGYASYETYALSVEEATYPFSAELQNLALAVEVAFTEETFSLQVKALTLEEVERPVQNTFPFETKALAQEWTQQAPSGEYLFTRALSIELRDYLAKPYDVKSLAKEECQN